MITTKHNPVILLVDDDHLVRELCRKALERSGFRVLEADSPHVAQALWKAHALDIEMLVTDFEMPGMSGLQLSALLVAAKPSLKILLISGNCCEAIPENIVFLPKPFLSSTFVETVRGCLITPSVAASHIAQYVERFQVWARQAEELCSIPNVSHQTRIQATATANAYRHCADTLARALKNQTGNQESTLAGHLPQKI